jgi:membrane protease YdiL (CAAX protease family)
MSNDLRTAGSRYAQAMTARSGARSALTDAWTWLTTPPEDRATEADRRSVDILGLDLPVRASLAIAIATTVLLVDFSRVLLPPSVVALGRSPEGLRAVALERVVLLGVVPLLVVLVGFRDRPARYGLTLGDARAGVLLSIVGVAVMTPIVLWFATLSDVRSFYGPSAAPLPQLIVTNALDLTASEFLFRGFLMLTLIRVIGPIGVFVAVMPFAFGHMGKPALELLSTVGGGLAYGWLAWRTRSIVWGSIAHVYIVTLVIAAASS